MLSISARPCSVLRLTCRDICAASLVLWATSRTVALISLIAVATDSVLWRCCSTLRLVCRVTADDSSAAVAT
ncbi:hypothetical protein D3C76_1797200 [compost metagenome]